MHTAEDERGLQLGLGDIALLAKVRRPVPSMWRTRSADSDLPFPLPVARVGREERFTLASVVDWLEATGRGCNPDARDDAAAYASPPGLSLHEPTTYAGGAVVEQHVGRPRASGAPFCRVAWCTRDSRGRPSRRSGREPLPPRPRS